MGPYRIGLFIVAEIIVIAFVGIISIIFEAVGLHGLPGFFDGHFFFQLIVICRRSMLIHDAEALVVPE